MAPSTGEFYTFTLADTTPTPVTTPTKQATDPLVNQYLNTSIEFKMDDFSVDLLKTETTPPPGGNFVGPSLSASYVEENSRFSDSVFRTMD